MSENTFRAGLKKQAIFITATDTGVGKSLVGAGIARGLLRAGQKVNVCKPVECGHSLEGDWPMDAKLLQMAALSEDQELPNASQVVPYVFTPPIAPTVAARLENRQIELSKIESCLQERSRNCDLLIIEGAGGIAVPLTEKISMGDFAARYSLPTLIVARAGLGTLNHTILSVEYARARNIPLLGIVVNDSEGDCDDQSLSTNAAMLEELADLPVLASLDYLEEVDEQKSQNQIDKIADLIQLSGLIDRVQLQLSRTKGENT